MLRRAGSNRGYAESAVEDHNQAPARSPRLYENDLTNVNGVAPMQVRTSALL